MRGIITIMVVLLIILVWVPASLTFDDEYSRETLRGLQEVYVLIEQSSPDTERGGPTTAAIQSDVQSRLRKAGIRVLTQKEWHASSGASYLRVRVGITQGSGPISGVYAYCIEIELNQAVVLERNPSIRYFTATWSLESFPKFVSANNVGEIRGFIANGIDEFIKAHMAMNGR